MNVYESTLESLVRALDELKEIIEPLDEFTWLTPQDSAHLRLKQWVTRHPKAMDFPVFQEIKKHIDYASDLDSDGVIESDLIKLSLEDGCNGQDLVWHAAEVAGVELDADTSFDYFLKCEKDVDAIRRRIAKHEPGKDKGYVYILTNHSMPDMVKIGITRRDPAERIDELSGHTGVPEPFRLSYSKWVLNCALIEERTHMKLSTFRVSKQREFFRISLDKAKKTIEEVIREVYGQE